MASPVLPKVNAYYGILPREEKLFILNAVNVYQLNSYSGYYIRDVNLFVSARMSISETAFTHHDLVLPVGMGQTMSCPAMSYATASEQ